MEIKDIKKFLASFKDSDLEELKFEDGDAKISFKRGAPVEEPKQETAPAPAVKKEEKIEKKYEPLRSTMVGTFLHSDKSDHPPLIIEGNHVTVGMKVGIIEAMKVTKAVESHVNGRIVKVLVRNGQPVEYGQELFLVDTKDVK